VEFWNLVFPQFDRSADGELTPLPQPGVDTGMGLERMTAVMQGVHSVYEIDLMSNLLRAAGSLAGVNRFEDVLANPSFRVISDHLRSTAFLIADGVTPGNENRDYVLRRIMRRGLRHGYKLNLREPFMHKLVGALANEMGEAYPELASKQTEISRVVLAEEERFSETLSQGMELLDKTIAGLKGKVIPGEVIFQLYDTYGFPTDMSADIARERGLQVDTEGFETAMQAQRERGRAAQKFSASLGQRIHADGQADFRGYEQEDLQADVIGLFSTDGEKKSRLEEGESGVIVLDQTPFYAESGGQVGDCGVISAPGGRFDVTDTQKSGDQHLHIGQLVEGSLALDATVTAEIDHSLRQRIRLNHSATHLLHAALRTVLGDHVQQKGSLVAADRLRFDFSHPQPVSDAELKEIEALVNTEIQRNSPVEVEVLDFDRALEKGAMALFGEKYGDEVRVMTMGNGYSVELCGGTHVSATGDIGLCKITQETGIAAGVRRIEAVSGPGALSYIADLQQVINDVSTSLRAPVEALADRVQALMDDNRRLSREFDQLNQKLAASQGSDLLDSTVSVNGIDVVAGVVQGEKKAMMQTMDVLKSRSDSTVVVLGQITDGKVSLVACVSKSLTDRLPAPDVLKFVAEQVGARGGGRPDMAQAGGGTDPDALPAALDGVVGFVTAQTN
jgi:alanyl-tRNA synthetase